MDDSITTQIENLLKQQTQSAPGMLKQYGSALDTARSQDQQSIDELRTLYNDKAKFEKPVMGALGLGMLKGTNSGLFQENMYNALSSAAEASDYNREANLSREEKLAKLASIQATLTRQGATDSLDVFDKTSGVVDFMDAAQGKMADIGLAKAPTSLGGDRPLSSFEEGPERPGSSPLDGAMRIYHDYQQNPMKYAGPQGKEMVKNAVDLINNERTNSRYLSIAQQRSEDARTKAAAKAEPKPIPFTNADKKIIDDAENQNVSLNNTINLLNEAAALGDKTYTGPLANTRARVSSWIYDENDTNGDDHLRYQQIMEGEAIKQMAEQLKGATTDREMLKFIDNIADPSLPWATKKKSLGAVLRFAKELQDHNIDKVKRVRNRTYWTDGEDVPPVNQGGAEDTGASSGAIGVTKDGREVTMEDIEYTSEQTGKTPEEIAEMLGLELYDVEQ